MNGSEARASKGVIVGDNDPPLIPMQHPGVQEMRGGQAGKAAVRPTAENRLLQLGVLHEGQQLEFNVRMLLPEGFEDVRQPLHRHAVERGHPHKAGLQPPQLLRLLLQHAGVVAQGLYVGQQRPPVRRQRHAAAVAGKQRNTQFVFQRGNGVADARLGEVQLLCRPCEAAAVHHCQKYLIFCHAHASAPPF